MGLNYKVDYGSESNVMMVVDYAELRIHGMRFYNLIKVKQFISI